MLALARHPEHLQKLREELAPYMPDPAADVMNQKIANLDHLNGVIYEALRMYPPVPTAVPRMTPPEGIEIEGVFVPGNLTVWCPQYAMGRSKQYSHKLPRLNLPLFAIAYVLCRGGYLHARERIHT